jgi:hypothetical protein
VWSLLSCSSALPPSADVEGRVVPDPVIGDGTRAVCGAPGNTLDAWPCTCDSDCLSGAHCNAEATTGQPGGRCSRLCTAPQDCPKGACIVPSGAGASGVCEGTCDTSADCAPSSYCQHNEAPHLCLPMCQLDGDCGSGHCNLYTGWCSDGGVPSGAGVYEPCLRNEDCKSGLCSPSGRCLVGCAIALQRCPDGAICESSTAQNEVGLCLPRCTPQGTCTLAGLSCKFTVNPPGERACAM